MENDNQKSENAEAKVREVTDQVSDKIGDALGDVTESAKDGVQTIKGFVNSARQYVEKWSLGDVSLREILESAPWVTLSLALAAGWLAAQIPWRLPTDAPDSNVESRPPKIP